MANLRRQILNMKNDHADEINRWRYAAVFCALLGFGTGVIAHMIVGS